MTNARRRWLQALSGAAALALLLTWAQAVQAVRFGEWRLALLSCVGGSVFFGRALFHLRGLLRAVAPPSVPPAAPADGCDGAV